jgi:hypothetical protein
MKVIKEIQHPDVSIKIMESFDEGLNQMRYTYEYKTGSETLIGGVGPNGEIIYPDMLSAVLAAHSLLSDDLKNLMKIEYLLM